MLRPMRRALILAALLSACATSSPARPTDASSLAAGDRLARAGLSVRELAEDAYLFVHASPRESSANVLVVRMRDGTVVICSSPYDTETTRALVRHVRDTLAPSRIVAINTHFHADGTHGNEAYDQAGVETIASDHTAGLQAERGERGREGMASYVESDDPDLARRIRATRIVPARTIFPEADGWSLGTGGDVVRALFVGPGHSPDNVVVYFARQRILFGGCMVRSHAGLGNTGDADLDRWADSVDAAARLDPAIVVPGHGPVGGPELLARTASAARAHPAQ